MLIKLKMANEKINTPGGKVESLAGLANNSRYTYLPINRIAIVQPINGDHFNVLTEMGMVIECQGDIKEFEAEYNRKSLQMHGQLYTEQSKIAH